LVFTPISIGDMRLMGGKEYSKSFKILEVLSFWEKMVVNSQPQTQKNGEEGG
jgi:hypothetical protein